LFDSFFSLFFSFLFFFLTRTENYLFLNFFIYRAATVQAQTDAILWAVDRVTFRRIVMDNTFRKRKMYEGFLKTVRIFQTLENDELVKVADALEPQTFDEGDTISLII